MCCMNGCRINFSVNHGRCHVGMAEHLLYNLNARSRECLCCHGMSHNVRGHKNSSFFLHSRKNLLHIGRVHLAASALIAYKPYTRMLPRFEIGMNRNNCFCVKKDLCFVEVNKTHIRFITLPPEPSPRSKCRSCTRRQRR